MTHSQNYSKDVALSCSAPVRWRGGQRARDHAGGVTVRATGVTNARLQVINGRRQQDLQPASLSKPEQVLLCCRLRRPPEPGVFNLTHTASAASRLLD